MIEYDGEYVGVADTYKTGPKYTFDPDQMTTYR